MRIILRVAAVAALSVLVAGEFALIGAHFRSGELQDYGLFLASGRAVSGNPYALVNGAADLNPPSLLPLFALLANLPPAVGWQVLTGAGLFVYVVSCIALLRSYRRHSVALLMWLLAFAPLWHGAFHGQVWPLLTPFAVFGWLALKANRPILAGLLIGVLVAVKINFGAWVLFLLLAGQLSAFLGASASFLFVSLVPAVLYGPRVYLQWVAVQQAATAHEVATSVANGTLISILTAANLPMIGYMVAVATFAVLGYLAWRRKDTMQASRLGVVAAMICSPIAWFGYAVYLLPLYIERRWTPAVATAAVISLFPLWFFWHAAEVSPFAHVLANALTMLPLLLLLVSQRTVIQESIGQPAEVVQPIMTTCERPLPVVVAGGLANRRHHGGVATSE